jgi:predicted ribosome quality control (RQC) complex YloA/Tae2 family protein
MLRNRIAGANLTSVEQYEFDRILTLEFEREDTTTTLVAELFGDGNVAVLDAAGEVIDCLETVRLKSRTVAPAAPYEYPDSRIDPFTVEREAFVARMAESDSDVVRTLATQLNLGGFWAEEVCTRAGIEKTTAIDDATEDDYSALYETLTRIDERLRDGDHDPRVYREDDRVVDVSPLPLEERADCEADAYDRFTDALDEYFYRLERQAEETSGQDSGPDYEAEIAKHERIIDQQEAAIADFADDAEREREKAKALYANYDLAADVLETVQDARETGMAWADIEATFEEGAEQDIPAAEAVDGVDGENGTVTITVDDYRITLDASAGVEKNADQLYQEAKRIEEKRDGAKEAITETREALEAARERKRQAERSADEASQDDDADESDDHEPTDWLDRESIPVRSTEQWYEAFRWFHTSDGFLVIGGRNADQNEQLVQKYLDAHDRFFHAQAHGGPATILKASGPSEPSEPVDFPETTLHEAAQFAVSYSSVWKDGRFSGDAYAVDADQVTKTPESGEYLEKGGFAIRGDREYFRDVAVGVAVGITCEPETRVIGGPPAAIEPRATATIRVEPGQYAQNDIAKRLYREFREQFTDTSFVRKVASPDLLQEFLPPGGSRMSDTG